MISFLVLDWQSFVVYASMGDPRAAILAEQMLEAVWLLFPRAVPAGLWLPLTLAQQKKKPTICLGVDVVLDICDTELINQR